MKWEFSNIGRSKQEEQSMKNFQDNWKHKDWYSTKDFHVECKACNFSGNNETVIV
jgi:hypothetical protein